MSNNRNYGRETKTFHFKVPQFTSDSSQTRKLTQSAWSQLNTFEKHKQLLSYYPKVESKQQVTTEAQILKDNHVFIREEDDASSWEARLAKKYYDKLFKEYGLANLDRYRENKIALRWRTEKEVVSGKGQFVCGNLSCVSNQDLKAWEVPFAYTESNEKKLALVKLKLCKECSYRLNYKKIKEERKKRKLDELLGKDETNIETTAEETIEQTESICKPAVDESAVWNAPLIMSTDNQDDEDFDSYLNDLFS